MFISYVKRTKQKGCILYNTVHAAYFDIALMPAADSVEGL